MPRVGLPLAAQPLWLPTESLAAGPWEDIASSRLGAAAASVSFASIPAAFVMFRLVVEADLDANAVDITLTLNNDTGANYAWQRLLGDNATVSGTRATAQASIRLTSSSASQLVTIDAVIAKPIAGAAGLVVSTATGWTGGALTSVMKTGIWSNTADLINRIDIAKSSGNFNVGSLFILQGSRF